MSADYLDHVGKQSINPAAFALSSGNNNEFNVTDRSITEDIFSEKASSAINITLVDGWIF